MELDELKEELEKVNKEKEELELRFEELSDFMENASLPLHWVNGSGIIIWANKAEYELLGYTKEEYIGSHISNFHADKNVIEDILFRLIKKETLRNYPARLLCKNGEIRSFLINSNVLWKDGEFIHTRCFSRDITSLNDQEREKVELINILQEQNLSLKDEIRKLKEKLKNE